MTDASLDTESLGRWIASRIGAAELNVEIDGRPSGGFSAETILLTAKSPDLGSQRFVVRLETPEPAVYPPQSDLSMPEIEIQYRIMDSIGRNSSLPIAGLVGYESDPSVLGTPFFVMHHVDGAVPIESPPYSVDGFFTDLSATDRTSLIRNGLEQMSLLHQLDPSLLDLDWLTPDGVTPGSRHLLHLWRTFGESELHGRSHPLLESAWTIIERELPSDSSIGLCWGDPRPGNIIWNDSQPACLTDFEAACIGPPEFDLGWWLMFDRTMHELAGIERLPGDPTRDEQRSMYFSHAGRDVVDTSAHELSAAARYCVIVVRVINRLDQRGLLPAVSMVWRDNPATDCLRMILDERS
jgi:aminoglycoside phosphotransferase (APT) family kinase protein